MTEPRVGQPYTFLDEDFERAEFIRALEKYGTWPLSVWEYDHTEPLTVEMKRLIGDYGDSRRGSFMPGEGVYGGKVKVTIFNPQWATWAIKMFCPEGGKVYDPFAGGGTRGAVAAALGRPYEGLEIRQAELESTRERIRRLGFEDLAHVQLGDAMNPPFSPYEFDHVLTCPPYWNLERYGGGPNDLSMAETYDDYIEMMERVAWQTWRVTKPGALAVFFVGLIRDVENYVLPINHDVARAFMDRGWKLREEIVLYHKHTPAILRIGNFDRGSRRLIRTHEYALVFERSGGATWQRLRSSSNSTSEANASGSTTSTDQSES